MSRLRRRGAAAGGLLLLMCAVAAGCAGTAPGSRSKRLEREVEPLESARRPGAGPAERLVVRALESPSRAGLYPSFAATSDGEPYLVWTEEVDDGAPGRHRLLGAAWRGGDFGEAELLAEGEGWFVNWADLPTASRDAEGRLVVSWLERMERSELAYGARVAVRAGAERSPAVDLMADASGPEYGFVSLVPLDEGGARAFWLDGRSARAAHAGSMGLFTRAIGPAGELGAETVLDERVCDCCNTAALRIGEDRVLIAYRDREADEVRDISLLRGPLSDRAAWSAPEPLRADGWRIEGCPVNGPALAAWSADGQEAARVAACWFTAAGGRSRVWVACSEDGGERFDRFLAVDEGQPAGRVDVAFLSRGVLVVTWLEFEGETWAWKLRVLRGEGADVEPAEVLTLGRVAGDRRDGFLRLAQARGAVLAAWTDGGREDLRLAVIEPQQM